MYSANNGKTGETKMGYRDKWNFSTATQVLLRTRLVIHVYGSQFPQLEEHIVPGSEPAAFR